MNGDNVPRFSISQVVFFYGLPRSLHRHSRAPYTVIPAKAGILVISSKFVHITTKHRISTTYLDKTLRAINLLNNIEQI